MFLLPDEKVALIQDECCHLVSKQVAYLSQLSHIIGKFISCKIAVLQDPLHFQGIQHLKSSSTHLQIVNNADIPLDLCSRGSKMVGRQSSPCKGRPIQKSPSQSNSIRCLQFRVGSSEQWGRHQVGHGQRRKPIFI